MRTGAQQMPSVRPGSSVAAFDRNRDGVDGKHEVMRPSFEVIFEAEFPGLHRYLRRRVGSSRADDLTAATFASAYTSWECFDAARPVRPWLYGIAANLVRRHWRDEERMLRAYARTGSDPVLVEEDETLDRVDAGSRQRELAAALASLRPVDRELLLLHAWAELSDAEIAAALSLPLGTVKSRLHRTREALRNRLTAKGQPAANTMIATVEERR
jgi:RNA polymerase sigma-70 factor (ECF subfamily)